MGEYHIQVIILPIHFQSHSWGLEEIRLSQVHLNSSGLNGNILTIIFIFLVPQRTSYQ